MEKRLLPYGMLFGVVGIGFYLLHVILGGILWEGYSHLMQPISDLTATGAPNRGLLIWLTNIYGILCLLFAISMTVYSVRAESRLLIAGSILFILMQVVSLSYALFPQDLPGAAPTFRGTMHIAVTFLIVPLTIGTPLLIGLGLRQGSGGNLKKWGTFSIICGIGLFLMGGTAAAFFATELPYFGLVERINIGILLLWIGTCSVVLFQQAKP